MIGRKTSWVGFALSGLILAGFTGLVRAEDAEPKDSVKTTGPRVAAGFGANGAN
jgi:hypothetical protein